MATSQIPDHVIDDIAAGFAALLCRVEELTLENQRLQQQWTKGADDVRRQTSLPYAVYEETQ